MRQEDLRQSRLGRTPLHLAAARGDCESAKKFVENLISDPSTEIQLGRLRPMLRNIRRDTRTRQERTLIIVQGDRDGITSLHEATIHGHKEVVEMFLKLDVIHEFVDLQDHQERTALHWATALGQTEIAQLLINAGANCSKRDRWGAMALSRALGGNGGSLMPLYFQNVEQVEGTINQLLNDNEVGPAIFLLKATRDYGHADHVRASHAPRRSNRTQVQNDFWTVMNDHWTWFDEHWKDGVSANSKDEFGKTPLTHAAEENYEAVVRLLCAAKGVNVNLADERGWAPLSYAADRGFEAVVRLLLATEEIDVNSRDNEGRTPLSHAAGKGQVAIVKHLLATEEIDVDPKDNDDRTPLSYAAENGSTAVAELLVATGEALDKSSKSKKYGRDPYMYAAGRTEHSTDKSLLSLLK